MTKLPRQYKIVVQYINKIFDNVSVSVEIQSDKFQVLFSVAGSIEFDIKLDLKSYSYTILYGDKKARCKNNNTLKRALITLNEYTKDGTSILECGGIVKKIKTVKKSRIRIDDFVIEQELIDILNEDTFTLKNASNESIASIILLYRFLMLMNKHIYANQHIIYITGRIKDWYQLGRIPTDRQKSALQAIVARLKPIVEAINDPIMAENYEFTTNSIIK